MLEDTRSRAVAVAGGKLENGVVRGGEHSALSSKHSPHRAQSTEESLQRVRAEVSAQCAGRADAIEVPHNR